jgi:phosphoribosyl 1,2-cyclic phosphodiesterase
MVLKVIGSSSKGNCYLLEASDGVLIIEAGNPAIEIKKALHFKINNVIGCLISHQHRDHSKFLKDVISSGIKVLALEDVFDSHKISNRSFCKTIEPMHGYKVGGFKIFALPVAHDVPCLGFIIEHQEMGKTLFITDTMMLEYIVPNLNHIMIEVNYCDKILQENIDAGIVPVSMRDRLLHSHMEIQTAKDIIKANDLSNVKELILLHLSDNNSNSEIFKEEMEKVSGKPVYVAKSGLELNLWR